MADEEREKAEAALNARLDAIAQRLEWISNSGSIGMGSGASGAGPARAGARPID